MILEKDRFFDPDPTVRRIARTLYEETRELPLICPHGHVDPRLLAENRPFPEPTALLIIPDHYIFRMLYSQGVPMEALGIPTRDGTPVESDPRRVWQLFGEHYYLFRGTPTGVWFNQELHDVFGVRTKLSGETAQRIYDEISEKLESPEFRPRALFDRFNIEVLTTTDAATDTLEHHRAIQESGWQGRVIPAFRPDAVFRIAAPGWQAEVDKLGEVSGTP
ncbi:MAG: glucuronate isomerase, partial [Acidobacteriota bacterium]|nr:glucuronate isomerase [Acidobacteriota bacterium]